MLSLLSLANKTVGQLSDDDLQGAAKAIGGENADGLVSFFRVLRDAEPSAKVTDLLATPSANTILRSAIERLSKATEEKEGGLFCRCPNCDFPFIAD